MKIRTVALAGVAIAALASPAFADDPGWYLGVAAGYSNQEPVLLLQFSPPPGEPTFAHADYKPNWIALASGGYKFESGIRIEAEFGFDEHDLKQISTPSGAALTPAHGG